MTDDAISESIPRLAEFAECQPELLLPDQSDLARAAFEIFLKGLGERLPGCLGVPGEIRYAGARQGVASSVIPEEPGSCGVLLELSPTPGQALLFISRTLASAAIESLLGAPEDLESEGH